jgi:anti-anti-sigma factor
METLAAAAAAAADVRPRAAIPVWVTVLAAAAALVMLGALAAVAHLTGAGRVVIYLLVISAAAYFYGLPAGLAAALLSVVSAWYYAVPPPRSLVPAGDTPLTLGVFTLVACATAVSVAVLRGDVRKRREIARTHALLASVVENSEDAIHSKAPDGTILTWNAGAERLYGYTAAEAIGRHVSMLVPEERAEETDVLLEGLRRGQAFRFETVRRRKDGTRVDVSLTLSPIRDGAGRVVGSSTVARDITERRREEERRRVLAEAAQALAGALDVPGRMDAFAHVVVPALADFCGVHVIRDGAAYRRFVAATDDPDKIALIRELEQRYPVNPDAPVGTPAALRTGKPALYRELTDEALAATILDPALRDGVRRIGVRSAMFVPLVARGRTLGAVSLISIDSGRVYGPDDLALAEDLAQHAALALDNALLHEREQTARREAERAADRTARLQTVTAALSRALTPQEVAGVILAQGLAALGADAGAVYLLDDAGATIEMIGNVHYPPDVMRERRFTSVNAPTPLAESVKYGTPFYLESAEEAVGRYPSVRGRLHPLSGARAIVPTIVRGRPTGTLIFIFRDPRRFAPADREFAESLAAQCAQAFERARLYAQQQHAAATLQQALLPRALPEVPGVVIDAAHLPGTPGADVGGDWYDAFRLPDGRVVIAIGDVVGRGLEAAVTMGQVRQAVRAAAFEGRTPAEVLALVGRILPLAASGRDMTTAIVGILDSLARTFTYAAAGHPAPLLASRERLDTLPSGGLPLGYMDRRPAPSWTIELAPGALLVLYTDGLIESRRDASAGLTALSAVVEAQARERSGRPAHDILDRLDMREAPDDVALVAVAVDPQPLERLDFTVPAEPDSLPIVRHALQHLVRDLEIDEQRAFAMMVAVGEAVNNVVEHAYVVSAGSVFIRAWRDDGMLRVEVADRGRWRPARPNSGGGRGLIVMRALADEVAVDTTEAGTTVRIGLALAGTPPAVRAAAQPHPAAHIAVPQPGDGAAPQPANGSGPSPRPAPPPEAEHFPVRLAAGAAILEVRGDVDMRNAEQFADVLDRAGAETSGPLIVSLASTTYLDSHGVAALFRAAMRLRTSRRTLYLILPPGSALRQIVNVTDVGALCPVFESEDAALHAVSDAAT